MPDRFGRATPPPAPAGIVLEADPRLRIVDDGRVLIGGAPLRVVRLTKRGAGLVAGWFAGTPVSSAAGPRGLARRLIDAGVAHPRPPRCEAVAVAIVVPVKDDGAGLGRCLAALDPERAEVIVVDDGSTGAAAIAAVAKCHGARLVRRDRCGGPGAARMSGAEAAVGSLIGFVDADVEVPVGWLAALAGHFDDPAVVAVAPRVTSRAGCALLDRYEVERSPLDMGESPSLVGPGRAVSYLPAAALVVRRSAFEKIGGFDLGLRFGEDVDLIWRLVDAGGRVVYDPTVEVVHQPRASWARWIRQRHDYGSSAAPLGRRHGAKVAPVRCSPWSMAAWAAVAMGRPKLGVAVAARSSLALIEKLEGLDDPVREALTLSVSGHLSAGRGLARAVGRVWWPLVIPAVRTCPRLAGATAAALIVPHGYEWAVGRRSLSLLASVGLGVVDDLAYGSGVWAGMFRERTLAPIRPDLARRHGPKLSVETATVD